MIPRSFKNRVASARLRSPFLVSILAALCAGIPSAHLFLTDPVAQPLPPIEIVYEDGEPFNVLATDGKDHSGQAVRHAGTFVVPPSLVGKHISNIYLGFAGKVGKTMFIDCDNEIAKLWDRKIALSKTTVVRQTGNALVSEYHTSDAGVMSLARYQQIVGDQAQLMRSSLDWTKVGSSFFVKGDANNGLRFQMLRQMEGHITGQFLMAYEMTEIMPTRDNGAFNSAYFDFIFETCGRRFVESIPAGYDTLTSFGPFQMTSHAVFDMGPHNPMGGATKVSYSLPEGKGLRIPGSAGLLRGDMHPRTGYLFAVANIATLLRYLDHAELIALELQLARDQFDLLGYVATAHNKPGVAVATAHRVLRSKKLISYSDSCPKASNIYAHKTHINLKGVIAFLKHIRL